VGFLLYTCHGIIVIFLRAGAHSFGHILTKKREISRTFALKSASFNARLFLVAFFKSTSLS
jgi:hypothetical protein